MVDPPPQWSVHNSNYLSAERAARAIKGEHVEDVSKWIFEWEFA